MTVVWLKVNGAGVNAASSATGRADGPKRTEDTGRSFEYDDRVRCDGVPNVETRSYAATFSLNESVNEGIRTLPHCAMDSYFLNSSMTDSGREIPWIDYYRLSYPILRTRTLPEGSLEDLDSWKAFWRRLGTLPVANLGRFLADGDTPIGFEELTAGFSEFVVPDGCGGLCQTVARATATKTRPSPSCRCSHRTVAPGGNSQRSSSVFEFAELMRKIPSESSSASTGRHTSVPSSRSAT